MVSGRWADMWIHECISDFIPFLFLFSYTEGCRQQMGETDWVFWSQQWNICFNSFILGLQVGILNQIQSNLVGKPMCARVCVCVCVCVHACVCARAQLCPTLCNPMGSAYQAPLSMEFSRQEDWSGFPCPALGMEAVSPVYPALAGGFFIIEPPVLLLLSMNRILGSPVMVKAKD